MTELVERDWAVHTEGGRLFARSWSQGDGLGNGKPPVLLFHDSLGCVELWRGFPEKLARATGRPVIAYDRLGFGRSYARHGSLQRSFIADEAVVNVPAIRAQLGFSRFVVCGHSVGGGMAIHTAASFPGDCGAAITMGAQAFVEARTGESIKLAKAEFAEPENFGRLVKYHGDKARWVLDAWTETWLDPEFADWTLDDALGRVRCPVLAIHGASDEYGSTEHPRRIAGARGAMEILPGVGHVPHREDDERVLDIVGRFLADK